MKKSFLLLLLVSGLIGGGVYYGFQRHASRRAAPEIGQKIALAEKLVEQNEPGPALALLRELEVAGHEVGEKGDLVRVLAAEKQGAAEAALKAADQFKLKYPQSTALAKVDAARLSAALSLNKGSSPELKQDVERFLATSTDGAQKARLEAGLARKEVLAGDFAAAGKRIDGLLASAPDSPAVREVAALLGEENLRRLFSKEVREGDQTVKVASGDSINRIARKNGVTEELMLRANAIRDAKALRIGQVLRVPAVQFSLLANIADNLMILRNKGEFFKLYEVRSGRVAGTTPVGEFKVLNKKRNPTWRPGNGRVYLPGDPNNELGTRWMSFQSDILGIHGTLHPDTIGHYASNGCLGMTTADVEELHDLITVGTPLTITGEQDTTRRRVIAAPEVPPPAQVAKVN